MIIKLLKKNWQVLCICFVSLVIYFPSLFVFYTNDDFFHLKISHAKSLLQFLNFFNLEKGSSGQLLYRPLTTHVFYFLDWLFFNLNPLGLHIVLFLLFFVVTFCIYRLTILISNNKKIGIITTFLYAVSATHFGHLYYLATEIILGVFFFPTVIFFIDYLMTNKAKYVFLTVIFFILALMAKENSVVLPAVFILVYTYLSMVKTKNMKITIKQFSIFLAPFILILLLYLYFHFFYYGFVQGDSYIWNLSPFKALNTTLWYGLWSLNLPEMLVDFVGPGIHVNPNLMLYWSKQIIPIFVTFVLEIFCLAMTFFRSKILNRKFLTLLIFCVTWFLITLSPVLFLPLHKFTFYLTIPLFGVVFLIAYAFKDKSIFFISIFGILWTLTSVLTLNLTRDTNWITQGELVAKRVFNYVNANQSNLSGKTILFYDTDEDKNLPFSPTETIKNTLSDNNFFDVFYGGKINAIYTYENTANNIIRVESRMFLGY